MNARDAERLEKWREKEEELHKEIADHIETHDPEDGDEVRNLGKLLIRLGTQLIRAQKAIDNLETS